MLHTEYKNVDRPVQDRSTLKKKYHGVTPRKYIEYSLLQLYIRLRLISCVFSQQEKHYVTVNTCILPSYDIYCTVHKVAVRQIAQFLIQLVQRDPISASRKC